MKAARIHQHGNVDVIAVDQVEDPQVAAGEVLVDVKAASLNHLDIWVRTSERFELSMPHIIGSDGAGVVAAMGPAAHGFQVGQDVIINPALSCGCCDFCLSGQQSLCTSFAILGAGRAGTFAQRVAVPAGNLMPKPAYLSYEEAACVGIAYVTAWRMLVAPAQLRAGEWLLIHGIGGGVALAGLQIAKRLAGRVIVTSSDDAKLERARPWGADHAINYRTGGDVASAVKACTGGRGVDVAMDAVGAAAWPINFACVRRGGRIVTCGVTTGAIAPTDLQALYWNQLTILGSTSGSHDDFRGLLSMMEGAQMRPIIDSVWPLDQVREASKRMEDGRQMGKIVLKL